MRDGLFLRCNRSARAERAAVLLIGAAVVVACLAQAGRARACSCEEGPYAKLEWPLDGATDVPTDTPIVVWRYYTGSGVPEDVTFALMDDDGAEVALVETRHLAEPWIGCGPGATTFLRPAAPLTPGATYTFVPPPGDGEVDERWAASFTVTDAMWEPEASITPEVTYLKVSRSNECMGSACPIGEVHLDFGGVSELPRWIEIQSAAEQDGKNVFFLWSSEDPDPNRGLPPSAWQLSVTVPPDDPCIDVRVYGVDGSALFDEQRCEPDRCARYDLVAQTDCGDPPQSGIRISDIAEGSCDDASPVEVETDIAPDGPDRPADDSPSESADAGAPTDDANPRATPPPTASSNTMSATDDAASSNGGCAMSPPRKTSGALALALGLLLLSWRRNRRSHGEGGGSEQVRRKPGRHGS